MYVAYSRSRPAGARMAAGAAGIVRAMLTSFFSRAMAGHRFAPQRGPVSGTKPLMSLPTARLMRFLRRACNTSWTRLVAEPGHASRTTGFAHAPGELYFLSGQYSVAESGPVRRPA